MISFRLKNKQVLTKFGLLTLLIICPSVFAQMRPQKLEINGQTLSVRESMDLILQRTDKTILSDTKDVKLNGENITPYTLKRNSVIFVRTESGGGDTTSYEAKKRTNKKVALACDINATAVPNGIEVKKTIQLRPGESAFLMVYDDEYMVNGNLVNLYHCPKSSSENGTSKAVHDSQAVG